MLHWPWSIRKDTPSARPLLAEIACVDVLHTCLQKSFCRLHSGRTRLAGRRPDHRRHFNETIAVIQGAIAGYCGGTVDMGILPLAASWGNMMNVAQESVSLEQTPWL